MIVTDTQTPTKAVEVSSGEEEEVKKITAKP